ncbi:MAG: phosphatase [Acidimicrobiia bacterium]
MSKRATHRPPHLEPAPVRKVHREPRLPSPRSRLVKARVAGRHDRLGRAELLSVMRRIVGGDPVALLGLDRFPGVELAELQAAASDVWGWSAAEPMVAIDPDRLLAALVVARDRVLDVAHRGGRILLATSRPASLLPLYQHLARLSRAVGGHVLDSGEAGPIRAAGRASVRLWWIGGVAVLTDGDVLLSDPGIEAIDELLFTVPYPDLVVADRGYAGGALRAGIEVVAMADLDAVALGLAACRGLPVTVVPMHERRPACAYAALEPLLAIPPSSEAT